MMNLVSRYSVSDPNVLASTASESTDKTKSESQNVPLSSLNEQQTRTGRPVLGASSSNYSEWNIDDKWSSQEWKSGGEVLEARTERPVSEQPAGSFTQHTDRFQDSDIAGDLEDTKSTSGRILCMFGSHTFCSHKLDVQGTNFCSTQFNRIRGYFT